MGKEKEAHLSLSLNENGVIDSGQEREGPTGTRRICSHRFLPLSTAAASDPIHKLISLLSFDPPREEETREQARPMAN